MSYVDIEIPDALKTKILDLVTATVNKQGKIKKGMNETTKAIERGVAKLVVIAGDITPAEIVMHLPAISKEKKVPYVFVDSRAELGKAAQISIPCSALAITQVPKDVESDLKDIVKKAAALRK
ncbi:MAG: 50S ribosomal protein L7ae [Promethearchaeia archaeon]|nr:MAG: 50S ribosomal protein L7ae [Candidatus Lokiarchaeia archaeon]